MKTIHVLRRIDRLDHGSFIYILLQWELDEDAVNSSVVIEIADQFEQFVLTGFLGQMMLFGCNPNFAGEKYFVFDIDPGRNIVADQHAHKTRRLAMFGDKLSYLFYDLYFYILRDPDSTQNFCSHSRFTVILQ